MLTLVLAGALSAETDFRCVVCKQKVQRGFTVEGSFYCPEHLDTILPHCSNCGVGIRGQYRLAGPKEVPVCKDCQRDYPQCFLCNVPVNTSKGGIVLKDGRELCAEHNQSAVRSEGTARRIFSQAVREIVSTLGTIMRLDKPLESVRLVNLDQLKQINDHGLHSSALSSGKVLGLTTLKIRTVNGESSTLPATVHLLNYVDQERMLTVSAHEYAHAWQAENHQNYKETNQVLREGFAEWVAYKVAERYGRSEQLKILTNSRGGVYYKGLMKFLALERKVGVEGVLEYATGARSI